MYYLRGLSIVIDTVIVFTGSHRDFDNLLDEQINNDEERTPFMEVIQHYNARIRPNETGVGEAILEQTLEAYNCIAYSDDYASVVPHVLSNFVNIVTLNYEIDRLFLHNPPRKVLQSIKSSPFVNDIKYYQSDYQVLSRERLKLVYNDLSENVLGQEDCKKKIIAELYRLINNSKGRPAVIMLYGPSGVGKTETAKSISNSLGGELLRIQFSMMQTEEAVNYVFGSEHTKNSLAKDILNRESNVILIDEFDKVNSVFYNAFYELFDEGKFSDSNYDVSLHNSIFILTSNFFSEEEIENKLGPAMFSRIASCIKYEQLSREIKELIINKFYDSIFMKLEQDERELISETNIKQWFIDNADRYDNIRMLKNKMENAVYLKLAHNFIFTDKCYF